jgi:hypothetical protein
MKFLITILLAVLVAYVSWPYYHLYRLDNALGSDDIHKLAPLINLAEVREHLQQRVARNIDQFSGGKQPDDSLIGTLQQKAKELVGRAVDESISLEQVRDMLRDSAREHSEAQPPYLLAAVDFAFFESPDTFQVRLGAIDRDPAYIIFTLQSGRWMVSNIIYND